MKEPKQESNQVEQNQPMSNAPIEEPTKQEKQIETPKPNGMLRLVGALLLVLGLIVIVLGFVVPSLIVGAMIKFVAGGILLVIGIILFLIGKPKNV